MMRLRMYPILLLVVMGSIDCLTTVIGVVYFGAVEVNPLIAGIVSVNLFAFVFLKLATTVLVCIIFLEAEKILMRTENKNTKTFAYTHRLLEIAYVCVIVFLVLVVANNIMVLLKTA